MTSSDVERAEPAERAERVEPATRPAAASAGEGSTGDALTGVGSSPDDGMADRVAEAVRAVPGVADLHGGVFGEVATYLPGRNVAGVRITDERVDVHVSVVYEADVRATAEQVADRVESIVGREVHVTVDDVVHPLDQTADSQKHPDRSQDTDQRETGDDTGPTTSETHTTSEGERP
ncbi:Asp23/Gls24 family envelope stress response protein [Terracoccus luteus]|uniref:Putative alkaline shock family protein YloU n=1 Tax=Terracoccus luteus TaxID=53356 RepID=A0A839PVV8_9MICO|nr:Asp23/Gls24 family envelope stress response protein [Terracoccus luteus]MBB2988378.1 putative alkaline shock family protein YloU [Terracoccus luteus]MCP2173992.1 putative alkaline shock family protein YloU [Terracoccus luteus]